MNQIKISHEVPLSMLGESRNFNDYDYALVHLFEKYPKYYEFFKTSLKQGREVILDNSVFELKEAFLNAEFARWVIKLNPTKYIIPDVLGNAQATCEKIDEWFNSYPFLKQTSIGVVQGNSYESLTACYKAMSESQCDELAICFHYPYYEQTSVGRMVGRQMLIDRWLDEGVINKNKKHHLLGCSLPQEFKHYVGNKYSFINSLDTSNPIIAGVELRKYVEGCLYSKSKVLLADNLEMLLNEEQKGVIKYNIESFKNNLKVW